MPATPPRIPTVNWRPLHPLDMPAVRALLDDAVHLDGPAYPRERPVANLVTDTLAGVGMGGLLVGYVWLHREDTADAAQVMLDGRVAAGFRGRGIGRYLLAWADQRAAAMLADADGVPRYLTIYAPMAPADARHLFWRAGFTASGDVYRKPL
jgi:GNAT superfamily N-acetyltransferase